MTTDLQLAKYNAAHRQGRERTEEGHIDTAGKREKKWRGWYHVYIAKADGTTTRSHRKRIIGPCAGMTKAEAREEHRAWLRQNILKQPIADSGARSVSSLCDDYMRMRASDWEGATAATNRSVFEQIIKPAIGDHRIGKVTADDLKRLLSDLPKREWKTPRGRTKKGTSTSYAKKTITFLRAIFDLAHERDLITKNPARSITVRLTLPKGIRKTNKSIFPPEHLPAFLTALCQQDRQVVNISFLGGTRPNETFALIGKNVGPDWIRINRAFDRKQAVKDTKTGEARFVYLPPDTMHELRQWITDNQIGPSDLVFQNQNGGAVNRENFLKRNLRRAAKQTGIPDIGGVTFQMLRRSFATLAKCSGMDTQAIQLQLGHSRPDMTLAEYIQPTDAPRIAGLKKMEDILRGRIKMDPDAWAKLGTEVVQ